MQLIIKLNPIKQSHLTLEMIPTPIIMQCFQYWPSALSKHNRVITHPAIVIGQEDLAKLHGFIALIRCYA